MGTASRWIPSSWRGAREARFATRFIDLTDQVNTTMPMYTVSRITELLNTSRQTVAGADILALGVSYKPGVTDDRGPRPTRVRRRGAYHRRGLTRPHIVSM